VKRLRAARRNARSVFPGPAAKRNTMAGTFIGSVVAAGAVWIPLVAGLGAGVLAPPASAQVVTSPAISSGSGATIGTAPATPFRWNQMEPFNPRGVQVPDGLLGDWLYIPPGIVFRMLPSLTPDPIIEVILMPPLSGHPTQSERFKMQWPLASKKEWSEDRALVIAFHPFNVSEQSPFVNSDLPYVCHDKGWIMLAPLGLSQAHFGNVNSQGSLEAVLAFLEPLLNWNRKRVYAVGFSMGGGAAVSYSMRHQSPESPRIAAVINHTGTMDLVQEYDSHTASVKAVLANDWHFNGTPLTNPFSYERVSPFLYTGNVIDDDVASVCNVSPHTPMYIHWNEADPNTDLVMQTMDLVAYLETHGATIQTDITNVPGKHVWSTLDVTEALDWAEGFTLANTDPTSIEMYADRKEHYLYTELIAPASSTSLRHYEVIVSSLSNQFQLISVDNVESVGFDLKRMGLDTTTPLTANVFPEDATTDKLVLRGYPAMPSSVAGAPPVTWSWNAVRKEVQISTQTPGGTSITVTP